MAWGLFRTLFRTIDRITIQENTTRERTAHGLANCAVIATDSGPGSAARCG